MNFTLVSEQDRKKAWKIYSYDFDEYEDGSKSADTLVEDILADPQFPELKELIIGDWGEAWEESCQSIIDGIVEHADRFSHIEKLFLGAMNFESCEISWIIQGNYSKLWAAMPQLKGLTIKGSTDLELGEICHEGLESLEIMCGGLPVSVFKSIQDAKLPNLKKLVLYIGVANYGFDGNIDTIKEFLAKANFPKLEYLGLTDSDIQDEVTEAVLDSKFMGQIHTLDLSKGTLSDKGGALLLEKLPKWPNVKYLDLSYNYLTNEMAEKLDKLPMEVDSSEREEAGKWGSYPMVTE